ncbi:Maf family protein [uncultured Bifidobacterium sp.]|uniref:Maf family protein n=1 Tax=uncultured Bifidobacterium sp. TaxID=165187 RepID=UPI0028DC01CE|nr:Maf family protein [uncultured Bifidobacterium sp.]
MTGAVPGTRRIPLILASQSPSRRAVLVAAGILPTIRVSHVDEDAVLREEAGRRGVDADSLDVGTRVAVLAQAKADAVVDEYREIRRTAERAHGERVTAFPLRATAPAGPDSASQPSRREHRPAESAEPPMMDTRDFSGVDVPIRRDRLTPALTVVDEPGPGPLVLGCDSLFLFHGRPQGKPHDPDVARSRLLTMRGDLGELWTGHTLVDLATGRAASETSHARVRFGDYDDRDVDAYVATGEPLEVAGSFTLEGFGGAFIDGVDGDPHGVLGLSLPLVRGLAGELGARWPELWNLTDAKAAGPGRTPVLAASTSSGTPKGNIHQPGDGWVDCACGRRHWGLHGAAGVLLARRDPTGGRVTHVVMQHRALWSAEGGTWGVPGGAIADGESPVQGALRESLEEASIPPQDIDVVGSWREEHGSWAYTTVFAFEREGRRVEPRAGDDESMEIAWVPVNEVASLRLLTALRVDWPRFRRRLDALAADQQR